MRGLDARTRRCRSLTPESPRFATDLPAKYPGMQQKTQNPTHPLAAARACAPSVTALHTGADCQRWPSACSIRHCDRKLRGKKTPRNAGLRTSRSIWAAPQIAARVLRRSGAVLPQPGNARRQEAYNRTLVLPMKPTPHNHCDSQRPDAACTARPEVAPSPLPPARWATRLRRHLTIAFVAKVALLALLYLLFFSPSQRVHVDAGSVAGRFFTPR